MVQRTIEEFGRIDILINKAGGSRLGGLAKLTIEAWDSSFDLNVRSAYLCTHAVGRHRIAQRSGAIVNISSTADISGVKGGAHYASAKAALQMFTTVTAAEWGCHGIRANCVAAGMIASERAVEAWKVAQLDTNKLPNIPLGRTGTPDEVANAMVFFASDAASYITGQTIAVSGGPSMSGIPDA
jgi:NAD(P)-dependent dehydrogenase (short-subunit alcohol dehydrogenase family)